MRKTRFEARKFLKTQILEKLLLSNITNYFKGKHYDYGNNQTDASQPKRKESPKDNGRKLEETNQFYIGIPEDVGVKTDCN